MRGILGLLIAVASGFLMSCSPGAKLPTRAVPARAVSIAAAGDLRYALDELLTAFRQEHPDWELRTTYGASGNLFAQIGNGAPFDLFLSADI